MNQKYWEYIFRIDSLTTNVSTMANDAVNFKEKHKCFKTFSCSLVHYSLCADYLRRTCWMVIVRHVSPAVYLLFICAIAQFRNDQQTILRLSLLAFIFRKDCYKLFTYTKYNILTSKTYYLIQETRPIFIFLFTVGYKFREIILKYSFESVLGALGLTC